MVTFSARDLTIKIKGALKSWIWYHGGEKITFAVLFFNCHMIEWQKRDHFLKSKDKIENLQRFLAVLSLIVGVVLMFGHTSQHSSAFERAVDTELPYKFLGLYLHRWFGLMMIIAGSLSFVAIMEWPATEEEEAADNSKFEQNRLRILMRMQIFGTILSGTYWFISLLVTLDPISDPIRMPPLVSYAFAYVHYWLCMRINRLYVQSRFRAHRAQKQRWPDVKLVLPQL